MPKDRATFLIGLSNVANGSFSCNVSDIFNSALAEHPEIHVFLQQRVRRFDRI